jgi:adenylate cyclase
MKKVLIIDDEPDFVEMIKMRLEANKYDVVTANDGQTGFQQAIEQQPDLILLDVMMPGVDGFGTLRWIKNDERTWNIPVVMLTAKRESKTIFKADEGGVADYLIKPCETADLLQSVARNAHKR